MKITPKQLRTLQTLFGLYAGKYLTLPSGEERAARLAWASQQVGHEVASFSNLPRTEAGQLIDTLKLALGQQASPPRPRLNREAAMARGTHGRRGRKVRVEVMATPEARQEVERLREQLGWPAEGFERWLRSPRSPLCGRTEPKLLTISDCNRVRWALLAILRRSGSHTEQSVAKAL
jgi:hypothetical protein